MNFVLDKMFQNYRTLVLTLIIFAVFENSSTGAGNLLGSAAPHFRVQSGEDKELTSEVIKGKVTAIFYENKDIVYANKPIKDELNKLYSEQPAAVKKLLIRLPIIDCSNALSLVRGMWKKGLREQSKRNGVTIYCDWNGQMAADYKMKSGVSNIVIIDKSGAIRFFSSGEVEIEKVNAVKQLLIALAAAPDNSLVVQ